MQHGRRRRANSLPAPTAMTAFAATFRSVANNGILTQNEMRRRDINFEASHDGAARVADVVEVTRVQHSQRPMQQVENATRAATNAHHGALTVALERGASELDSRRPTQQEVSDSLPLNQRAMVAANADLAAAVTRMTPNVLTPMGQTQAQQRMHSSFVAITDSSQAATAEAHETTRQGGITPTSIQKMVVPQQHLKEAKQVAREVKARGNHMPPIESVNSTQALSPNYMARHQHANAATSKTDVSGVSAPAYHQAIAQQASQRGVDQDIHLVKTPEAPVQNVGRRRARSF